MCICWDFCNSSAIYVWGLCVGVLEPSTNNRIACADFQSEQVVCKSDLAKGVILNLIDQVDVDALSFWVINQADDVVIACVNRVAESGRNRNEKIAAFLCLKDCCIHVCLGNAGSESDNYLIGGYYSWRGLNRLIDPGDGLLVIIVASCHASNKESEG